jgi:hypothetical protein
VSGAYSQLESAIRNSDEFNKENKDMYHIPSRTLGGQAQCGAKPLGIFKIKPTFYQAFYPHACLAPFLPLAGKPGRKLYTEI